MPTSSLSITTDAGDIVKQYSCFSNVAIISLDIATGFFTVTFQRTNTAEEAAAQAQRQVTQLQAENKQLKAQVNMLQQQQTFLEDCILEMADTVYA